MDVPGWGTINVIVESFGLESVARGHTIAHILRIPHGNASYHFYNNVENDTDVLVLISVCRMPSTIGAQYYLFLAEMTGVQYFFLAKAPGCSVPLSGESIRSSVSLSSQSNRSSVPLSGQKTRSSVPLSGQSNRSSVPLSGQINRVEYLFAATLFLSDRAPQLY